MKTSTRINQLRRWRASMTVRAVLETQNHCRVMSMRRNGGKMEAANMESSLAAVYDRYTYQAKNRARELGLIDSIEAQRVQLSR